MKVYQLFILSILLTLTGCQKYLEVEPRALATIKTADQLEALVNNANAFASQTNYTASYSTDDTEISLALFKNYASLASQTLVNYYALTVDNIVNAGRDDFWTGEYKKIFTANLILSTADKVTGGSAMINQVKADAYLIRAYSYWELANYYCLPYSAANLETVGLPLKKTTSYEESLKRSSLKETYDFILSDLMAARNLISGDVQAKLRWRASRPAIDAFLSRFFLFTGDYNQALSYANLALGSTVAKLKDFKTIGPGVVVTFPDGYKFPYSALALMGASEYLYWDEFYYTRFNYNPDQWNIPSPALLALYDQQSDLRFETLMVPNSNRRFFILEPATYRYSFFNDGSYIPEGPTVAEVLLNKAEALARKGDGAAAIVAVNNLREKRFKVISDLTAGSGAPETLKKILEERRRELPFVFRWLDIRRFAVNNDPSDDVTFSKSFFKVNDGSVDQGSTQTISLPLNSRRYVVPINGTEIINSKGQIEQNTY